MLPADTASEIAMCALSKALTLLSLPALLLPLLVLTARPGGAVISNAERDACTVSWTICADQCSDRLKNVARTLVGVLTTARQSATTGSRTA